VQPAALGHDDGEWRDFGHGLAARRGDVGQDAGHRRTDHVLALGLFLHAALLQLARLAADLLEGRLRLQCNGRLLGARGRQLAFNTGALALQRFNLDLLIEHVVTELDHLGLGIELFLVELLCALKLVARRCKPALLRLDLDVELRQFALEVGDLAPQGIGLLLAEKLDLLLLAFEHQLPFTDLALHQFARGHARRGAAFERQADQGLPGLDLVALLGQEVGYGARFRREDARGTGVEREKAVDAFAPGVLAPDGKGHQRYGESARQRGEDPQRDRTGERNLAEQLFTLRVDRLLAKELFGRGGHGRGALWGGRPPVW
jgi:hypothetical protein